MSVLKNLYCKQVQKERLADEISELRATRLEHMSDHTMNEQFLPHTTEELVQNERNTLHYEEVFSVI